MRRHDQTEGQLLAACENLLGVVGAAIANIPVLPAARDDELARFASRLLLILCPMSGEVECAKAAVARARGKESCP